MIYLIKSDGMLGYSTIESTSLTAELLAELAVEGYRDVEEIEFICAKLLSRYTSKKVMRIMQRLADEVEGQP